MAMHQRLLASGRKPGTYLPPAAEATTACRARLPLQAHPHGRASSRRHVYNRPTISPYDDDYEFSLTQYMVTLDKPIGITLAPDPLTGQVFVQAVQEGQSAAESQMVRVGDRLLLVSAASSVLGDDMWPADDLNRTRWAINNRLGKVKLVFERSAASLSDGGELLPPWYFKGREGINTWQVPELQLPIPFDTDVGGELADSTPGVGRILSVSFNRCIAPEAPEQSRMLRAGLLARHARADALLGQLSEAAAAPEVDYVNPMFKQLTVMDPTRFQVGVPGSQPSPAPGSQNVLPFRRPGSRGSNSNNSSGSSSPALGGDGVTNSSAAGDQQQQQQQQQQPQQLQQPANGSNSTQQQPQQKMPPPLLVQVLPWLMVSSGPLLRDHHDHDDDLAQLATSRGLSCLLEMRLSVNAAGLLCNRGQQPPPLTLPQEHPVSTAQQHPSDAAAAAAAVAPEQPPPLHAEGEQQQQQQQPPPVPPQQQQQQQPPVPPQQQQQQQQDLVAVAASMAGVAGPDMGFASAAVAAAAAAAATQQQQQQEQQQPPPLPPPQELPAAAGEPNNQPAAAAAAAAAAMPPGQATLQAHAILHCLADLQRLAVRRQWRGSGTAAAHFVSSAGNVYSGSYNGYNTSHDIPTTAANTLGPSAAGAGPGVPPGFAVPQGSAVGSRAQRGASGRSSEGSAVGLGLLSRQLLLQCEGRHVWHQAGVLLAAWLHWCGGVEQAAAVDSVSKTLGVTIDQVVLSEVRRLLLVRAKERFSKKILSWPYGGVTAEVSGELVGGWTERVPMTRCTNPEGCLGASKGHFYLELKGLAPGCYHYKYIIDNTWAVDGLAPKVLDSQGNWNNVLKVAAPPRIESQEEQAHYAALQAMWAAFERKMHFLRGGHHSMSH